MIIAFGHKKRTGKDSAGQYLERKYGFVRLAFADALKEGAMAIFGLSHVQCYGPTEIKEAVDPRWDMSPRGILQAMGEGMRQAIYPDVWVRIVQERMLADRTKNYVITDLRYPNEAQMVRKLGGMLVRIDRPGIPQDNHISETAMDDFEYDDTIYNTGSDNFRQLYASVDRILNTKMYLDGESGR